MPRQECGPVWGKCHRHSRAGRDTQRACEFFGFTSYLCRGNCVSTHLRYPRQGEAFCSPTPAP